MKILLATDGSESSGAAARFLSRLNLTPEDEVKLLHVISDIPFMEETESYDLSLRTIQQEIAPRIIDSTVELLAGIPAVVTKEIAEGHPATAIVDSAVKSSCDLVVIGSRGLKGISSFLLGSIARSVAISSPLPVLVIRQSAQGRERLRILYAVDGSDEAEEAGRLLAALPFPQDSELTVMTVITSSHKDIPERYWMELNERMQEELSGLREKELALADRIVKTAAGLFSERFSPATISIRIGDPAMEIVNTARDLEADIIVVGSRGLRGIQGMLGSVSRDVMGHAPCSVLMGKGRQR